MGELRVVDEWSEMLFVTLLKGKLFFGLLVRCFCGRFQPIRVSWVKVSFGHFFVFFFAHVLGDDRCLSVVTFTRFFRLEDSVRSVYFCVNQNTCFRPFLRDHCVKNVCFGLRFQDSFSGFFRRF